LFIVNPVRGGIAGLFSTHPPMEERIRRLEQLAREI
jgi:heat shock protein HtpX